MTENFHERIEADEEVKLPSERSFAMVFASVFAVIGLFPLVHGGGIRWWSIVIGAVFLIVGLAVPSILRSLNKLWMRFGLLLHRVVNPLVLGLMFWGMLVPAGYLIRMFSGKLLASELKDDSYWIRRKPPGPDPESVRNQF